MANRGDATAATEPCSIAAALEIVGDRWTILILRDTFPRAAPLRRVPPRIWTSPAPCSPIASAAWSTTA
ncbi:MAG: hypothetical protein V9E94_11170 [Microthrixaceae bacterium]